jgi:hypothetical protein
MRVTFTQTIATDREAFYRGQTHDLPAAAAAEFIRAGAAVVAVDVAAAAAVDGPQRPTAATPPPRGRRAP